VGVRGSEGDSECGVDARIGRGGACVQISPSANTFYLPAPPPHTHIPPLLSLILPAVNVLYLPPNQTKGAAAARARRHILSTLTCRRT
jgi:hypothetical protein